MVEHCKHCKNEGTIICHCGGDVCLCGLEWYECPYCESYLQFEEEEYLYA